MNGESGQTKREQAIEILDKTLEKHLYENFKVLRLIYAISYVVGFRELLLRFETVSFTYIGGCVVLLFLAIRLFWAVGNIRRYVFEKIASNLDKAADKYGNIQGRVELVGLTKPEWFRVMAFDVPILLFHSFLFFLLCKYLPLFVFNDDPVQSSENLYSFLLFYNGIILLNAFWLKLLKTEGDKKSPEYFWMFNNLLVGIVGIVLAIVVLYCNSLQGYIYWFALLIYMISSLVDFYKTGWVYIIGKPG